MGNQEPQQIGSSLVIIEMTEKDLVSCDLCLDLGKRVGLVDDVFRTAPMERVHLEQVVALLQNLSIFEPSPESLDEIWLRFSDQTNAFPRVVLNDESVVAFGVLLIENKVRGGKLGHIEDVVSHPDKRGLGAGSLVVRELIALSMSLGCYKVALHCQAHNVGFYEKQGLYVNGQSMQKLF